MAKLILCFLSKTNHQNKDKDKDIESNLVIWKSLIVGQVTIPEKLRNSFHDIEGEGQSESDRIAFAIFAMFLSEHILTKATQFVGKYCPI